MMERRAACSCGRLALIAEGEPVRVGMHNCNFFDVDVDAEGKFTRVIIWMARTNPLVERTDEFHAAGRS